MRAFVAVDPSEAVCARLARTIEQLRPRSPSAKWLGEEHFHITLAFLGEIEPASVGPIVDSLASVTSRHDRFELGVGGGGTFGRPGAPRVLWVGITAGGSALEVIQRDVEVALALHLYQPEGRLFAPHLTLARSRDPRGDAAFTACAAAIDADLGTSEISALKLYESVPGGRGARYVELASLPLERVI